MSTARASLLTAAMCGAALGACEALWVLLRLPNLSPAAFVWVLLCSCVAYGVAAVAALLLVQRTPLARHTSVELGASVAFGTFVTTVLLANVAAMRQIELWWLMPVCLLYGVAAAALLLWLSRRVLLLRRQVTWAALSGLILLIALLVAASPVFTTMRGSGGVAASKPNVLLISIDTLRADRLGCYGRANAQTPNIDAFAATAAVFDLAVPPMPLTGPSHTTMLTGLYPTRHGAMKNGVPLRPEATTIAEVLAQQGYATAAFVSGIPLVGVVSGLGARFHDYDDDLGTAPIPHDVDHFALARLLRAAQLWFLGGAQPERAAPATTSAALEWLRRPHNRPFFVFLHYFDVHTPYAPPPRYAAMHDPDYRGDLHAFGGQPIRERAQFLADAREVEHIKALYAGEISAVDTEIGRLLDELSSLGLAENTLIVITADHGESLTEHDSFFEHARSLYEQTMHVPLIIRFPDGRASGTRWPHLVRLTDVAPTILQVVGVSDGVSPSDGRSLIPVIAGDEVSGERVSFGSVYIADELTRHSVRTESYKLIWTFDRRYRFSRRPAFEELFDLSTDPEELHNLAPFSPAMLETLRAQLRTWVTQDVSAPVVSSAELRERMRALGYY